MEEKAATRAKRELASWSPCEFPHGVGRQTKAGSTHMVLSLYKVQSGTVQNQTLPNQGLNQNYPTVDPKQWVDSCNVPWKKLWICSSFFQHFPTQFELCRGFLCHIFTGPTLPNPIQYCAQTFQRYPKQVSNRHSKYTYSMIQYMSKRRTKHIPTHIKNISKYTSKACDTSSSKHVKKHIQNTLVILFFTF